VGKSKLHAVIDCVGAIETIQTGFGLLATSGAVSFQRLRFNYKIKTNCQMDS